MARSAAALAVACSAILAQASAPVGDGPLPAAPWQPGPPRYSVNVPGITSGPTLSLYPQDGVVGVATGGSLERSLQDPNDGGKRWYFLELYDHMCPHCWYAVPIITGLAGAFQGSPSLRTASLNCHLSSNAEACFFLELISGANDYPTFLLCPPGQQQPGSVEGLAPRALGLLEQLVGAQRAAFMHLLRCRKRFAEPQAREGEEDPFLSARVVAEWVVAETRLQPTQPGRLAEGADFTDMAEPDPGAPPGRPGWLRDDKEGAPGVPAWVPGQRWFDALRGFVHLLHANYRSERHRDAVDSTLFLSRVFPVKGKALLQLAQQLQEMGPQEQPATFQRIISKWAQKAGLPDPDNAASSESVLKYMTCEGSTCAMWSLLHITVTAVAVRGISGRALLGDEGLCAETGAGNLSVGIHSTMSFVRRFVNSFLNCRQCKENFLRDYDGCEFGRCKQQHDDYRGLVLWLWRKHNAISLKVAMRHHAQVDRRWPMYEDCPACWRQELVLGGSQEENARRLVQKWDKAELDAPFNTDQVFWHLVRTYVGLTRVQLEVSDLSTPERAQVEAVLELDRRHEADAYGNSSRQHQGFVKHPPLPRPKLPSPAADAPDGGAAPPAVGTVAFLLALGLVAAILFCGSRLIGVAGFRPSRSPVMRILGAAPGLEDEDDDDLVPDSEAFKAPPLPRDEDPAAE